jgi:hypothetical protein
MGPPRSRTSTAHGRIIIAGTGRAGTTFLVQLFTALGFSTGYTFEAAMTEIDDICHGGLEKSLVNDGNPYVIKSPLFADQLAAALQSGRIVIHAAILPMRDLFGAAESRRRVYRETQNRGLDPFQQRGALWCTDKPQDQEAVLMHKFYRTVLPLVQFDVPIYFLAFPRLVRDSRYLFDGLQPLLVDHGVSVEELVRAHRRTARPELVHEFDPSSNKPDTSAP